MNPKSIVLAVIAMFCGLTASMSVTQLMKSEGSIESEKATSSWPGLSHNSSDVQWPPQLNQRYPDLTLTDLNGELVKLSSLHAGGKVLLIEPVGLSCKACQAFAGGHRVGGLFGHAPQPGLRSMSEYIKLYGRSGDLKNENLVMVQILFYGPDGDNRCPTLAEARQWAKHFQRFSPNTVFLLADESLIGPDTRKMIPGFQLVDKQFVLRSDAGNPPRQDVFKTLIPQISTVLEER